MASVTVCHRLPESLLIFLDTLRFGYWPKAAPPVTLYQSEYCQINESTHGLIQQRCQTRHSPKPPH